MNEGTDKKCSCFENQSVCQGKFCKDMFCKFSQEHDEFEVTAI